MTGRLAGERVLVVEDNPANQQLVSALLRRAGCDVAIAGTAAEAKTFLDQELPDAILMDIQLPDQDGLSFTRELLAEERTRAVPVIALTAHAMRGDEELALAAGCLGYLTKPIDTRTFADVVSGLLDSARQQTETDGNHLKV